MKLLLVLAAVTLAQADKLDRTYLPPNAHASAGSGNFLHTPNHSFRGSHGHNANIYSSASGTNNFAPNAFAGYGARSQRGGSERNAAIIRFNNENNGGTYSYSYETENGIFAEESGVATDGVRAHGSYSYTGDDGKVYTVRYTADENGFVPQGDHLPTPPPIPRDILKSLGQNSNGHYGGNHYSGHNQQRYNSNVQPFNSNRNFGTTSKSYLPPRTQRRISHRNFY